jgi:DNA-binding MarR family transcriptional regulator
VSHSHLHVAFGRIQEQASTSHKQSTPSRSRGAPIEPFFSNQSMRRARELVSARARRGNFFNSSLFSDPAWDILLELYVAETEGKRLCVSAIGVMAAIPATTVLRWLAALEQEGLVMRAGDPFDARRVFVSLTDAALNALNAYFQS